MDNIVIKDEYAEVIFNNTLGTIRALVSLNKLDLVKDYSWRLSSYGYAVAHINGEEVYMHRLVLDVTDKDLVVDHISFNKLDNRDSNLRVCNKSQNGMNRPLQVNNTSGHTGVTYVAFRNKWMAGIKVNGKRIHLGYFKELQDAIDARIKAEKEYFGEYSPRGVRKCRDQE